MIAIPIITAPIDGATRSGTIETVVNTARLKGGKPAPMAMLIVRLDGGLLVQTLTKDPSALEGKRVLLRESGRKYLPGRRYDFIEIMQGDK